MLRLIIKGQETFNQETQEFGSVPDVVVELEHSLFSLSKWESEHQKPFLDRGNKTSQEIFSYLQYMVISPDVDPDVLYNCSKDELDAIQEYIDSSQTATTFGTMPERRGLGEVITSELIYYWMATFSIPFECQYWHLNRLFALIRIFSAKNSNGPKMSRHDLAMRNRELNKQRREQLGTKG